MSAPAFALLLGIFYTGLGSLAMLPSLALVRDGLPYLFALFAASGALNALHIAIGLWGLVAWSGALSAVGYARAVSILLALLALGGVAAALTGSPMALGGHNVWLHGLTALAAAYVGFRSLARRPSLTASWQERRRRPAERRHAARPVALERRSSRGDRRGTGYGGSTLAAG